MRVHGDGVDTEPPRSPQRPIESDDPGAATDLPLGQTLARARRMVGMTLRAVETATGNTVTNGYLSQIEKGNVTQPSPNVLYHLAEVYGLDYGQLLVKAGHRLPREQVAPNAQAVEGLPLKALEGLTADERRELAEYIEFLHYRRNTTGGGRPGGTT